VAVGRYGGEFVAAGGRWLVNPHELNAMQTAPKVKVPAIFLLADRDNLVPPGYARAVVDALWRRRPSSADQCRSSFRINGEAEIQLRAAMEEMWRELFQPRRRTADATKFPLRFRHASTQQRIDNSAKS